MKKLTDKEFKQSLKKVIQMADKKHEDFEVQKILADLYYTICEGYIWQMPKNLYREWKIKQAVKKHKNCCDLEN